MFIFTPTTCICSLQPFSFVSVVSRFISNEIRSQIDFSINQRTFFFLKYFETVFISFVLICQRYGNHPP